jgi:hypothetical protein
MSLRDRKSEIAAVWFTYSTIVAASVAYVVLQYLNLRASPAFDFLAILYALLWGLAVTGAFLMVFHYGVSRAEKNLFLSPRYNLPILFMAQGFAYAAYLKAAMSLNVLYITTITLQSLATYFTYRMALKGFKLPDQKAKQFAISGAFLVLFFGVLAWQFQNFWNLDSIMLVSSYFITAVNSLGLFSVALIYSLHRNLSIDRKSFTNSFLLRIDSDSEGSGKIFNLTLIACFLQFACLIYFSIHHGQNYNITSNMIQLAFAAGIIDAWMEISTLGYNLNSLQDVSRLTSNSARKFLMRHNQKRDLWSAAVGMKTAFLHIEHDVERILQNNLPATFLRIRSEETSRIVETLMSDRSLITHSTPEQVACAVDPETSIRPCLDALKLCATIYLDAGLIIQRRLHGLIALLPIINPGLAAALDREMASSLLRKTKWFFYFDHLWVDQRILNTPSTSQYGIQYDQLSPEIRMHLINYMNGLHGLGNFIWFTQQAKDRITEELPSIAGIFTPHEITSTAKPTHLMFSIKFEELIPRLQRYYALDEFRQKIFDFEPGQDSQKLLNILSLQINNANRSSDCQRIIDVIASFKWKGFREKDLALRLLLTINERLAVLVESGSCSLESRQEIFAKLGTTISLIGYPSQIINQAHIYKIEIRNLEKIKHATLDARNLSHLEAWATLASLDFKKLKDSELSTAKWIIKSAAKRIDLMVSPIIQARILDSASNLIKTQKHAGKPLEFDLIFDPISSIIRLNGDLETASLIIDVLTHLNKILQKPVQLPQNFIDYFDRLTAKPAATNSYWQQAVASSWQEFKATQSRAIEQNQKAS